MAVTGEKRSVTIELDEEEEGACVASEDFIFEKIGEPVSVKPGESNFDLESPPAQPLAVSDRFQAIFVAHSEGFYVAKTKDVISSAKEIKEKGSDVCIKELCVVDVPIGKVHILALSKDSSMLAVTVGGHIHFFSVDSLLKKEQEPSFLCSLDESREVKDFCWRKKSDNSYVVLSRDGVLYQGNVDSTLRHVMDHVDAVDWSAKGGFIAVARKNTLSIFSSKFRERSTMLLNSESWINDTNSECNIIVDSIKWIRRDCIILGCIQLAEDGREDGYNVHVITSRDGKITEDISKPVVLSFGDLFTSITDDIVPFGGGPHLLLSYLENWELAFAANRKNVDEHITLIGWSIDDEQMDATAISFAQDNRLPRIELQENGDDNLIMGFGVDQVSLCEKIQIKQGVEEKEVLPYCILLCLTLEGKLIMFYVASVSETKVMPQATAVSFNDEEDSSDNVPLEPDLPKTLSFEECGAKESGIIAKAHVMNQQELSAKGGSSLTKENERQIPELNATMESSYSREMFKMENSRSSFNTSLEANKSIEGLQASGRAGPQDILTDAEKLFSGRQVSPLEKPSVNSSLVQGSSKEETQRPASSLPKIGGNAGSSTASVLSHNNQARYGGMTMGSHGHIQSVSVPNDPFKPTPSMKSMSSDELTTKSPTFSFSSTGANRLESLGSGKTTYGSGSHNISSNTINLEVSSAGLSPSIHSFGRSTQSGGEKTLIGTGKIEPVPAIRSSHISSQGISGIGSSPNLKLQPTKVSSRTHQLSGLSGLEPELSKHLSSVNGMAKELDALLLSIEQEGGFRDACIVFQEGPVIALERGLEILSDRCRVWKNKMEERLGEIQHLHDKTVQVFAIKAYMEGIVKQASNSQYWDLWNRQKLSRELEQKRRQMLKVNQDLTNQLIELERHFNSLELNKYGENSGVTMGRRVLHSNVGARHNPSLHSLYNTMNSQLAAAEQLSECLSNQMAVLKIESPSVKQQGVARELFESIGLPYSGDSFNSPDVKKGVHTPDSIKRLPLSYSAATKEQSRRNTSSATKNIEPETARRRRDSLDRSWASFEPPTTTVKRIVLQDEQRVSADKSSLVSTKRNHSSRMKQGPASAPRNETPSVPSSFSSGNKDVPSRFSSNQDVWGNISKQAFESPSTSFQQANDYSGDSQALLKSSNTPMTQENKLPPSSSSVAFASSTSTFQLNTRERIGIASDKSSTGVSSTSKSDSSGAQPLVSSLQSAIPHMQTPSTITYLPTQEVEQMKKFLPQTSVSGVTLTKATVNSMNHGPVIQENSSAAPVKNLNSPHISVSADPPGTAPREKVPPPETATTKVKLGGMSSAPTDQPTVPISTSAPLVTSTIPSPTLPASSAISTPPFSSFSMSFGGPLASTKPLTDANKANPSQSSSSTSSSSTPLFSSSSFSVPKDMFSSSNPFASLKSTSGSTMEPKHPDGEIGSKSEINATLQAPSVQPESSKGEIDLNSQGSVTPEPVADVSSQSASANQPNLQEGIYSGVLSGVSSISSSSQPKAQLAGSDQVPASHSTSGSAADEKNENLDSAFTQEDEMEEEAPETMSGLSLGSLGGFGIGSASTPTAPKPNPFGGPFANAQANPVSTPFTLTPSTSQQLFRPASFNFQPVQPSQPTTPAFSGGFGTGSSTSQPAVRAFGQPAQVGPGQQALGSVLGSFGQSRQLGSGVPGSAPAAPSAFGVAGFPAAANSAGGFGFSAPSTGGFASAATGGGFAGVASSGGGFANLASGGGGFAGGFGAAASGGGGFAGATPGAAGGFAGAASGGGGGFSAFGNNPGGSGFSSFGSNAASGKPPSELFTQMRR